MVPVVSTNARMEGGVALPRDSAGRPFASERGNKPRSMAPKEHGAWGQVIIPIVVALGQGRPTLASVGFAVAAFATFLAHEPLLVLVGQRGTRAAREASRHAKSRLVVLAVVAALTGTAALFASEWPARLASAACLAWVLVAWFGLILRGEERSTIGELLLACALPFAAMPVALSAQVPWRAVMLTWTSFALAYAAGILGVRAIIRGHREGSASIGWPGLVTVLLGIATLTAIDGKAGGAALLYWVAVAGCRAARPTPKSLRRIGWFLVACSIAQAFWLLLAFA